MVTNPTSPIRPLTVYKASAGSGKTFTLATEYIKLLVANPQNYHQILAVTFTNKATEEMKQRILSQLYGIWNELPDSQSYAAKVEAETGLDAAVVRQRAGIALHLLIHNYHQFRVQTIDAFFQSVLRNLARELNLTANLQVGINGVQVESLAVDMMLENLKSSDPMLQWLLGYIMENIKDDKGWTNSDTRNNTLLHDIKYFGRTIFHDDYKTHREILEEVMQRDGFIESYVKQLRDVAQDAEKCFRQTSESFFETLEDNNLTMADLPYGKSGVAGLFVSIGNGKYEEDIIGKRALACLESADNWASKKHPRRQEIIALAESKLIPLLRFVIENRESKWKIINSSRLTLSHLNNLRLLHSIEQTVKQINEESNTFLLSDTQHLLHELIGESDTPFVFEKIGAQLRHVMIDEFQDTSTIQWENFKILLQECMSHGESRDLIVGDVKQSIYRWRSGDWRLLNDIERQFPSNMMQVESLQTNYRSQRNIIDFNNTFFTTLAKQEYADLTDEDINGAASLEHAYHDVCQQVPDAKPDQGYVEIQLLPTEDYSQHTLELLTSRISQLLDEGVRQSDIAILTRTNTVIGGIANYITGELPDVNVVSDEAFRLDYAAPVNLIVDALWLLAHPNDKLVKAQLVKNYHQLILDDVSWTQRDCLLATKDLDEMLPEPFVNGMKELIQLPLLELAERIYDIFSLHRVTSQSAYVCKFFDILSDFAMDNSTGIEAFIDYWNQDAHKKTIQSDQVEGIRILTIHKSKGLEYDHVIIPYCSWKMEMDDTLWCHPQVEPFNQLPVALIDYSKRMRESIYASDYEEEHLQLTVDNLNILYVAFTRASKSLFVIGKRQSAKTRSSQIMKVLPQIADHLAGSTIEGIEDEEANVVFTYGTPATHTQKTQKRSDNVFLQIPTPLEVSMKTFQQNTQFRQSNKSMEFVADENDEETLTAQSYIKMGNVLHHVFSTIRTVDDIESALLQLEQEGIIYDQEITTARLKDMLRKRLQDSRVKAWFSPSWTLYNECTILSTDDNGYVVERRPDRVMSDGERFVVVDFKFGRPKPEHQTQVKEYMDLIRKMGHSQVEGFLWYVYTNKIETV